MSKVFWLDTETTGIDTDNCAIIQLAGLVEIDGEVKDIIDYVIKPHDNAKISQEALSINKRSEEVIKNYPHHNSIYKLIIQRLGSFVDKYNKNDKFVLAGYNVAFDEQMLRSFFKRNGDNYFGSFFFWPKIDVATYVAERCAVGVRLPNYQLSTICQEYEVKLEAHDALADIRATRELYYKLRELSNGLQTQTFSGSNGGTGN